MAGRILASGRDQAERESSWSIQKGDQGYVFCTSVMRPGGVTDLSDLV